MTGREGRACSSTARPPTSTRARRARHEARRCRGAARQLARLDQSEERQPHGLRHDGREVRKMRMKPVRRIVCVDGRDGKSKAIEDGPAPVRTDPARPGFSSTFVWATDSTPASIDTASEPAHVLTPPPGGSLCRVLTFPPEREIGKSVV